MKRNLRRASRRSPKKDDPLAPNQNYKPDEEEILVQVKCNKFRNDRPGMNRSCYYHPDLRDAGQLTECIGGTHENQNQLFEPSQFNPLLPETIHHLKELKKILCTPAANVAQSSQYVSPCTRGYIEDVNIRKQTSNDNRNQFGKYMVYEEIEDKPRRSVTTIRNIRISDKPRIKVISEKFSKYKKGNVELRKLEERVVCIEYDIYDGDDVLQTEPFQVMRAYFSVKPVSNDDNDNSIPRLPSAIKQKFDIGDNDFQKLDDKEIEIIDAKIPENRPYLEDLKRVLKRKQATQLKRNKSSLDLTCLYEMAKRDSLYLDDDFSNTNLLSKKGLEEIKELITKKTTSSIHGISRRRLKAERDTDEIKKEDSLDLISKSILDELLKCGKGLI